MPCRIGKLNVFVTGWMAYFYLADLHLPRPAWSPPVPLEAVGISPR